MPPDDLESDLEPHLSNLAGLVDLVEAAAVLQLRSPSSVYVLIERGLLEGLRHAKQVFVSRDALEGLRGSPALLTQRHIEEQLWSLLGDLEP
jgi:hypothetical protein